MEIKQLMNIHSWIRNTTVSEVLFVTALVLPLYLLSYHYALVEIKKEWRDCGLIFAVIIYAAGIIWMKLSQSSAEKDIKDITIIKNYILDKDFKFMSFGKINKIDKSFTEERVRELIFTFPNEIRLAKLKENKKGIKVISVEDENT